MKVKLSRRERILVLTALVAALFFAYHRYYLLPVLEDVGALKGKMLEDEKMLKNLEAIQRNMNPLIAEIQMLETRLDELEVLVPANTRYPEMIAQMERFAKASGVVLASIDFGMEVVPRDPEEGVKQAGSCREISVHVFVSGNYENILGFIREIEGSERLYNITGFDISAVQHTNGDVLDMSVYLNAYTLSEEGRPVKEPSNYDFMRAEYLRDNTFKPGSMD